MKLKNLIILCAVLGLLAGLAVLKKAARPKAPAPTEARAVLLAALRPEDMTVMVFRFGEAGKETRLAKEDGAWKIRDLYGVDADTSVVGRFIKQLAELKGDLRSDQPGLFADYGIRDAQGFHIILEKGDSLVLHLVVGSKRFGASGNFVRHSGRPQVFAVAENILSEFGMWADIGEAAFNIQGWMDGRVARFEAEEAVGLRIREGGKARLEIVQKQTDGQTAWESAVMYPFALSPTKIKNFFRSFNSLRARDVVAADDPGVFGKDAWSAEVFLPGGKQVTLTRGAKTDDGQDYYLKATGAYYFLVPVYAFDNFARGWQDIFAANPLKIDTEAVDKFEAQDLVAKKKFAMSKTAGKTDAGGPIWKTDKDGALDEAKAKEILNKFKDMELRLVSVDFVPSANALAVKVSRQGAFDTYTITESKKLDDGQECRFLKLAADPRAYCYPAAGVENLKAAIPFP